jgi:hypothetical protein
MSGAALVRVQGVPSILRSERKRVGSVQAGVLQGSKTLNRLEEWANPALEEDLALR